MGKQISRPIINKTTIQSTITFTRDDYNALNKKINNTTHNIHEHYFRECMMPLVNTRFPIPCYYFIYGSNGYEYISKKDNKSDIIKVIAIHYMDYDKRNQFINGYCRLTNVLS